MASRGGDPRREADVLGHRLGALAFPRGEKAAQVPWEAGAPPDVVRGWRQGDRKSQTNAAGGERRTRPACSVTAARGG